MQYRLSSLVTATAIGPPLSAFLWFFGNWLPAAVFGVFYLLVVLAAFALVAVIALSIPFGLALLFSFVADALLYFGRHPDNRR